MLKIVTDVSDIDYNSFIDRFFDEAREHPEQLGGVRIPGFARGLLKRIPDDKKVEIVSSVLESHQQEAIPMVEEALSSVIGPLRLQGMEILHDKKAAAPVKIVLEILQLDADYIFTHVMPHFYQPESGPIMFAGKYGGPYDGPYDLQSVQSHMKTLDDRSRQYLVAKGMSAHKTAIMEIIGRGLAAAGIITRMEDMHFFFK